MRRRATRAKPTLTIDVGTRYSLVLRVNMELRSGKVLLQFSPEAMSNEDAGTLNEKTPIGSPMILKPSYLQRAQAFTRGYLWLVVASMFLILAAGVLCFPQKTWNRMMMTLFGCVTLNIRGKAYRFCEQPPQHDNAGIPL